MQLMFVYFSHRIDDYKDLINAFTCLD